MDTILKSWSRGPAWVKLTRSFGQRQGRTCYYYSVESNTGAPNGGWGSPMRHKRGAAEAEYQDQVNKLATAGNGPTV